jgi:16S rRNA (adenine1518-N6/adenine1519-N6)-dimethyltransferase
MAAFPQVQIVHGDILKLPDFGFPHRGYKVVANLPYYITSAVLRHFLEREPRPRLMVVTLQREVAERIVAAPGEMSILAVSVQCYGRPRIVARIPPGAFYPPPEVDSAVLRVDVGEQPFHGVGVDEAAFFRVVRAGFGQKRKTLRNALSAGLRMDPARAEEVLAQAGVDSRRRAETLSLDEWVRVTKALATRTCGVPLLR